MSKDKSINKLLKKFEHIGFLDYNIVIEDLKQYNTISDKLDYLKTQKKQYYDKFEQVKKSFTYNDEILLLTDNNHSIIHNSIFGKVNLVTPLSIQEPVFKKYFKNGLETPEFTYWFLKYQAKELFNYLTNKENFKSNLNSTKLRETFIKSELKIIEDEEIKTKELFRNKEIDVNNRLRNDYYNHKEIIILRILDGNYYKNNIAEDVFAIGSLTVQSYYKHILLKPYLTKLLDNNFINVQTDKEELISLTEIEKELTRLNTNTSFISLSEDFNKTIEYKNKINKLKDKFNLIFELLITKEIDVTHKYFEFSSFNNYKNNLNKLFKIFKKNFYDATIIDFYKDEILGYKQIVPTKLMQFEDKISLSTKSKIKFSNNRKIEYLENLLKNKIKQPKLGINEISAYYLPFITNEIKNLNTGDAKGKFEKLKTLFLNSEFETELKELTKRIENSIIYFKKDILSTYNLHYNNGENEYLKTYSIFLESIHYYNEYKKLIEPVKEIDNSNKPQQKNETFSDDEPNIENLKRKQNNLIPKVSIEKVIIHFEVLTKMTNKNNKLYLTNEQFYTFINSTFIKEKPVKQKFNCTINTKKEVRKIFYDFYFKNKNKEYNQTSLKRKYFNILNDAFEGFNENDYTDFAK